MKRRDRNFFVLAFLSPACLIYGLFVVYPLIQSFVLSLYRWRGVSENKQFVGTQNFRDLAADDVFGKIIKHHLWLLAVAGLAIFFFGMLLAHATTGTGKGTRLVRSVYLFPQVMSMVVVAILWGFLFNPSFGPLTRLLIAIGMPGSDKILGDPSTALPAVAVALVWYAL